MSLVFFDDNVYFLFLKMWVQSFIVDNDVVFIFDDEGLVLLLLITCRCRYCYCCLFICCIVIVFVVVVVATVVDSLIEFVVVVSS